MRSRFRALAAALTVALGATAIAHDWVDTSKPEGEGRLQAESPSSDDISAGITEVYRVTVQQGQSTAIAIRDTNGCNAHIVVASVTGKSAKVKAKLDADLVRDQLITIDARSVGTTTAIIPVVGEDTFRGGSGSCVENTRNKLVIDVVESPESAEARYRSLWGPYGKELKGGLRTAIGMTRLGIRSTLKDLQSGETDPETAMMQIYHFAHSGLVMQQDTISSVLSGYKNDGASILSGAGFPPDCEPRGFGSGSGGPWDQALRASYLGYFGGLQAIDREMLRTSKQIDKLSAKGMINARMTYQPGYPQIPAYAPPSQNEDPGTTSVDKLQIQVYGGLSFQTGADRIGCLWFGGRYDETIGLPTATLEAPDGETWRQDVTPGGNDSWSTDFEDLQPGLTYRFTVQYPDESDLESCALSLPYLPYEPSLVVPVPFGK